MKGKFLSGLLGLVFCLGVFLVESKPIHAEEWTSEQKAVAESFQQLIDTAMKGDIEKLISFYHPQMSWWDYKKERPVDIDGYMKEMEEFYKSGFEWISCEANPLEIHVVDNVAVLYATYKNTFKDSEANEITPTGVWTAVFIKKKDKWLFLSNSYIEK